MGMSDESYRKAPNSSQTTRNADTWIQEEIRGCEFPDRRLSKRFCNILSSMSEKTGPSIPFACQDWAATKAAYRFFSNDRVNEAQILSGHFRATRERATLSQSPILVLHDTTELSYKRNKDAALDPLRKQVAGADRDGAIRYHTAKGILMHSSLVVTTAGTPLGIAAAKFWTRKKFKGCDALKRKINPTRVPIEEKESMRWLNNIKDSTELLGSPENLVHVGDRESDIYELFCLAHNLKTKFLVRACVDRLAQEGETTIEKEMAQASRHGQYTLQLNVEKGVTNRAVLDIKYEKIRVLSPLAKRNKYPPLELTIVHATETVEPEGRSRIEWKLITNVETKTVNGAIEKLQWYAMRWKIETFHKILKSGYRVEESKLRTSERLVNLLAVCCILSWRIFWMTMINRESPSTAPNVAFTELELEILAELVTERNGCISKEDNLGQCIRKLAQLGGYVARASDPPPGNMVIWRGLTRLADIQLGYSLGSRIVGN